MSKAIVFTDINSLDFADIRHNVIRIPEVLQVVKKAQEINDSLGEGTYFEEDFFYFLASENETYNKNIKLKSVLTSVVQLGLYNRYVKTHGVPQYILGDISGVSAVNILTGQQSFESLFCKDSVELGFMADNEVVEGSNVMPLLTGLGMSVFKTFKLAEDGSFLSISKPKKDLSVQVRELIEEHEVKTLVDVGPGSAWKKSSSFDYSLYDVRFLESIDIDPFLGWFWPIMNESESVKQAN